MPKNKAELIKKKVCPRCGERFSYIEKRTIGNNDYYYAVHETQRGGKRKVTKHYLGPERYIYCSMMHSDAGIEFRGMHDPERYREYLRELRHVVKGGR